MRRYENYNEFYLRTIVMFRERYCDRTFTVCILLLISLYQLLRYCTCSVLFSRLSYLARCVAFFVPGVPGNVKHVVGSNIALFHELLETGRYFSLGTIHAGGGSLKEIPLKEAITMKAGLLFDETVLKNFPAKVLIEKIVERIGNADEVQFRGKCKGKL